jgi:hypothetical protein
MPENCMGHHNCLDLKLEVRVRVRLMHTFNVVDPTHVTLEIWGVGSNV